MASRPPPESPGPAARLATALATALATWGGVGLLPGAPGTWGSLAALPFAWVVVLALGPLGLLAAVVLVSAIGVWSGGAYAARVADGDPGAVVIDEVAGQWLVLAAAPLDPLWYGIGFVLFRLFDIWKPWPVSWADRRVKGGLGIMLDDLLAGAYGAAALYGGLWLWPTTT